MVASVCYLPFKEVFNAVLCVSVLEHLEEPRRAVQEMRRVLTVRGKIIVSVPFLFPIHNSPNDYWRFTNHGLRNLFSSQWDIEKICAETTTQEAFAVLLQRLGYQTRMRFGRVLKFFIFAIARLVQKLPNPSMMVFGDIAKKVKEPDAFTSGYFLVAKRSS